MKLRVIEPCEEGWSNMEPRSAGRFCERCDRTVIDFTRLSVRQAEARVRSAGPRICGHALVHSGTGEAVLRRSPSTPRWLGGLALGAALGAGCAGPPEPLEDPPEVALAPVSEPPLSPVAQLPPGAPEGSTGPVAADPSLLDRDPVPDAAERARTAAKQARLHPPPAAPPAPHGYDVYDGMMDFVE